MLENGPAVIVQIIQRIAQALPAAGRTIAGPRNAADLALMASTAEATGSARLWHFSMEAADLQGCPPPPNNLAREPERPYV